MRLTVEIYADPAVLAEFERNIPTLERYLGNNGLSAKIIVGARDNAEYAGSAPKALARNWGVPREAVEELKKRYGIGQ